MWTMRRTHNPLLISVTQNTVNNAQNENCAFWVITQRVVVTPYRCFMTTHWSHLHGSKIQHSLPLDFGPIFKGQKFQNASSWIFDP